MKEKKNEQLDTTIYGVRNLSSEADSDCICKVIMAVDGVEDIIVNLADKLVTIRHNPSICLAETLESIINDMCFYAVIIDNSRKKSKVKPSSRPISILLSACLFFVSIVIFGLITSLLFVPSLYIPYRLDYLLIVFTVLIWLVCIGRLIMFSFKHQRFIDIYILAIVGTVCAILIENWSDVSLMNIVLSFNNLLQMYISTKIDHDLQELYRFDEKKNGCKIDGNIELRLENIPVGSMLVVKSGERIQLDGVIVRGFATIYEGKMTGASSPIEKSVNSHVCAGTNVLKGEIVIQTTSDAGSSSLSKLKDDMKEASLCLNCRTSLVAKFTMIYACLVFFGATIVGASLVMHHRSSLFDDGKRILKNVAMVLTVACPSALCLSENLPLALTAINLMRKKIFLKNMASLYAVTTLKFIAFDKTGTITNSQFRVQKCQRFNDANDDFLEMIAIGEFKCRNHPISMAIYNYVVGVTNFSYNLKRNLLDGMRKMDIVIHSESGYGICYEMDTHEIHIGNEEWMKKMGIIIEEIDDCGLTRVFAAVDFKLAFIFFLFDTPRPSASSAIRKLKNMNVKIGLISGDSRGPTFQTYNLIGGDEYHNSKTPKEKMNYINEKNKIYHRQVGMVGEGLNDVPSLVAATVGISIGRDLCDLTRQASDIIVADENLNLISEMINIAVRYKSVTIQNMLISILPFLILASVNLVTKEEKKIVWIHVLVEAITLLIVATNSFRCIMN